jgi:hypothetical protein
MTDLFVCQVLAQPSPEGLFLGGSGCMCFLIALVPILIVGLVLVGMYNSLVRGRNHVKESWAGIDTELKRRYDLIPNLVETVRGYARHEREVFERVVEARSRAVLTMLVQLSCANSGYLPTERAVQGGGYSADKFVVGPVGGQVLVEETVRRINELWP